MRKILSSLVVGLLFAGTAHAGEISVVSGLYKNKKIKGGWGESHMEVGMRYAEPLDDTIHWFGQGNITLRSYSGTGAPDDSTSLDLLGGVRFYFPAFSVAVTPFISTYGGYKAESYMRGANQVEESGLFYYGSAGFRFNIDRSFFIDTEAELFESALFATETEDVPASGTTPASENKTTRTEIYVSTQAPVTLKVGVGLRF